MVLTQPFRYFGHRILGRHLPLEQAAFESWIVEPESHASSPPSKYLSGSLDRVTGVGAYSTLRDQMEIISGGPVTHKAIRAFKVRNAALLDGNLYSPRHRSILQERCSRFSRRMLTASWLPSASLATTYFGNLFFGHWLTDDLPLALLGEKFSTPIATERPLTLHQREYLARARVSILAYSAVAVDELIVFDDCAQTASKRRRYAALRDRINPGLAKVARHPGVFLGRGSTGRRRRLINEAAVSEALALRGFKIIEPESHGVASLLEEISGAEIVVGVEGSHLLHGLFALNAGASFLVLQPPDRFSNPIKYYADALDIGYGFVVGLPRDQGFAVELTEVLAMLDVLRAPRSREL